MKRMIKAVSATTAVLAMLQMSVAPAAMAASLVTDQPNVGADIAGYFNTATGGPVLSQIQLMKLVQQKIKYVFVIFNENRSFDHEYGTFPGVNGLYSDGQNARSAANTPGFTQTYTDVNGGTVSVTPFGIGLAQNSSVIDSVDHSHAGLAQKLHTVNGVPQMDQFASREYSRFASLGGTANAAKGTQFARLVMSHIDCDTLPIFWNYASRFTIFDNIFATEDTPSTPNAVAMLAGQSGETQWVKHPSANGSSVGPTVTVGTHTGTLNPVPLYNDPQPFYGSQFDTSPNKNPVSPSEFFGDTNIAVNLTHASLPLTFQGVNALALNTTDANPSFDLPDVQNDLKYIAGLSGTPVNWRWYQEGYDLEPTDTNGIASYKSYVTHHNGAQYFGYIANSPLKSSLKGLNDFFTDMAVNTLPNGGVFYVRGGFTDIKGRLPTITNASTPADEITAINKAKAGDDNHPGYSDAMLSQSMNARVINAIAANPAIWAQSLIVITYDESDGFYDHVPPRILSYGPDGLPISRGIRIPLIMMSPYGRVHAVSHAEGDHNAVIQAINAIFNLPALSSLPDEAAALAAGNSPTFNQFGPAGFQQKYLGPRDTNSPITDSILSGFDPARLIGASAPLPASYIQLPDATINSFPLYNGQGCKSIGITPIDQQLGITNVIPTGFNPLASTYPALN